MSLQPPRVHEPTDVRDAALDVAHAEVTIGERIELDDALRPLAAVVPLEPEVAMRAIADESAFKLLIETPPPSPRPRHHPRADGAIVERDAVTRDSRGHRRDRLRSGGDGAAMEGVIEEHA